MKKYFIQTSLILVGVFIFQCGHACDLLFTGNVVQDYHSSGKVKTLKSISNIVDDFGDSSPIYNILVKKQLLPKDVNSDSLKVTIKLKMKKGHMPTETFKKTSPWKEDSDYLSFTDFDAQKFSDTVYLNHVEQFEISLHNKESVLCTKKVNVDSH
jgi:hypothetical protein